MRTVPRSPRLVSWGSRLPGESLFSCLGSAASGEPGCLRLLSCLRPGAWPPEARRASGSALRASVLARPRPSFGTKECFAETFPAVGREAAGPAGGPTNSRELVASGAPGSFSLLSRVNRWADEQGCQTVCGPVPVCGRGRTWRKWQNGRDHAFPSRRGLVGRGGRQRLGGAPQPVPRARPMRPRPCGAAPGARAHLSCPPREVTPAAVIP